MNTAPPAWYQRALRLWRYLLLQLAPAAAIVNVLINAFLGHVLYPATVPVQGPGSFANDSIAAAFLIGSISWLTVAPGARREAWSGRVPGFGVRSLSWAAKHPVLLALAWGGVMVAGMALPVIAAIDAQRHPAWEHGTFVLAKAAFDGLAGAVAAVGCALLALASEPAVGADDRWLRSGAGHPFEYLDKGSMAVTDNARGCSGTPTWQLVVDGDLDPAHVRTALVDVVTRYPSLRTKVRALDGIPPWAIRFAYVEDPSFDVDQIFKVVDVRGDAAALQKVTREELNRPLDRFQDFPLTLTLARASDHCRLFFRQHHGIADGRAFIGLLNDFGCFLEAARHDVRPAAKELTPIGRRTEAEALGQTPGQRLADTVVGCLSLLAYEVKDRLHPRPVLQQNRSNDYTGENGTVHWRVPEAVLVDWNAARKAHGVSLNSFLTGALCIAVKRWQGGTFGRTRINLPVETRPRDGSFLSFANHLASMAFDVQLDQLGDVPAAARAVQEAAEAQRASRAPIRRLLAETLVVAAMPLYDLQRIVFESTRPAANLDFSNLIPLGFPTIEGSGWRAREVLITTPVTPRMGILLTVIRYNGTLCFNFNYKASAATREQTEALAQAYAAVLAEAAPSLAGADAAIADRARG